MFLFFLCMVTGGLGMYGAASTPASQLPHIVHDIRAQLQNPDLPFGINLFVPPATLAPHTEAQQAALQQVHAYYADSAARLGLDCKIEVPTPDLAALQGNFEEQVEVRLDVYINVYAACSVAEHMCGSEDCYADIASSPQCDLLHTGDVIICCVLSKQSCGMFGCGRGTSVVVL
jgi:hypothetical protein